jgi:hypothetical protein
VLAAACAPDRPHFGRHIAWLEREIRRLGIEVRLGIHAGTADVLSCEPEAIIVATGSISMIPEQVAGVRARCATDVDLLDGRVQIGPGMRVLIYDLDGQVRGGGGAISVEVVTPLQAVCEELDPTRKPLMYRKLARLAVRCTPNQLLIGQRNGAILLRDAWSDKERLVDTVDLAIFTGYRMACSALGDQLLGAHPALDVRLAGDCVAPRRLHDAVTEGVRAGNSV